MECGKQNIKIVEGNEFALVLPLKQRTFVASTPIDEDIVYADLQDVVLKIGDTQFTPTLETYGVQVLVPYNALPRGTYDILLTATYHGSVIRASYFEAITRVQYNSQSDAQQYIAGSPIVLDAAYVIGGTLTDAELEALKEEYREKNAQLQQAIEDAEAAKAEWEQKAADLDGVAKESTLTQGVQDILAAMPSTGGLATESNATENKDEILAAIEAASMRSFSGHLDEIGLAQIGWGEDDIAWFRKRVDWDERMDEAMKVPQELIDAYNEYKDQHGGVVDSGFYTAHKGQWYFRYAPVVSSYPWEILRDAPYMLACPAAYYQVRSDRAFLGSPLLRYIPDIKFPSWSGPFGFGDWLRGKTSVYVVNLETYGENAPTGLSYFQSTFHLIRQISPNADVTFQYPPSAVKHLYVEARTISMFNAYSQNWLGGCLSCFLKGIAGNVRLIQPYITKKELIFAINNEASDGTTPYVITLTADMYAIYANDVDILAALSNHSNFALASA